MLNVLIVDDEPLALDVLETYVGQMPDLNLVKRCSNALEANEALKAHQIDLMFLDIQMPQLTGIDFVKTLIHPPMVVFTTAYPNYAIQGFDLNVLDYLLKPISLDRFMKAVNKALEQAELAQRDAVSANMPATAPQNDGLDFFFVKADKKLVKVNFEDIIYIEGLKDYVIIRLIAGRVITLQTMKSLEDRLPKGRFKRIHRSYIIAMDKIMAIEGNMIEVLEKDRPKLLPIGKNYRDELLELIEKNRL
ncbi:MAG TPA: LytTR family DNA-binding domain-containing protein [Saprospiraceae bacterium]|nr:LytTR family DNA-binding domain-containing protein [Saprospiraceae bacterium]HPI06759.1 LytTR family DNA-binding domain-containing protein [Saprospiraceae bacterium]